LHGQPDAVTIAWGNLREVQRKHVMSVTPSSARSERSAVYVYYRVPAGREAAVRERVMALFSALALVQPGLQTRLLHKVGPPGKREEAPADTTWMEVYEHPQGVSTACQQRMKDMAVALLADQTGPRHIELFAPVSTGGGLA
jgi:hypothetical protein